MSTSTVMTAENDTLPAIEVGPSEPAGLSVTELAAARAAFDTATGGKALVFNDAPPEGLAAPGEGEPDEEPEAPKAAAPEKKPKEQSRESKPDQATAPKATTDEDEPASAGESAPDMEKALAALRRYGFEDADFQGVDSKVVLNRAAKLAKIQADNDRLQADIRSLREQKDQGTEKSTEPRQAAPAVDLDLGEALKPLVEELGLSDAARSAFSEKLNTALRSAVEKAVQPLTERLGQTLQSVEARERQSVEKRVSEWRNQTARVSYPEVGSDDGYQKVVAQARDLFQTGKYNDGNTDRLFSHALRIVALDEGWQERAAATNGEAVNGTKEPKPKSSPEVRSPRVKTSPRTASDEQLLRMAFDAVRDPKYAHLEPEERVRRAKEEAGYV